ncbi:unnamed protein product [Boreogadus saida]
MNKIWDRVDFGLNALTFDPSSNNEPLQFGGGAGAPLVTDCVPPLENGAENSKKRKRVSLAQVLFGGSLPVEAMPSSPSIPIQSPTQNIWGPVAPPVFQAGMAGAGCRLPVCLTRLWPTPASASEEDT